METLEKYTKSKGTVNLSDADVEWRILDENRKGHGREFVTGHTAVIHEDEFLIFLKELVIKLFNSE